MLLCLFFIHFLSRLLLKHIANCYSARLKMLSAEIDKLREEFARANQEKSQQQVPPPAPPTQPPQNQYYDQYFDPTEDPLAFMRGPRRRANSFSGHGGNLLHFRLCKPRNKNLTL